jgi:peptide/nickel transport system permease protein
LGIPGAVAVTFVICAFLVAIFAPILAPHDPITTNISALYAPPSAAHPLGADASGRDLLSRLIWGSRTALIGPLLVVLISTLLGATLALFAAWVGGRVDTVISRLFDLLFAFPGLLLAILAVAIFGVGLPAAAIALAISYTPYVGRIVRAGAVGQIGKPYVSALVANGFGGMHVARRHLLPNLAPMIIAQASVLFGYAMIDLAAISFLGLGVQPPAPDWGSMVASGSAGVLAGHPEEALYAGLLIVLTVASVNVLGQRIEDRAGETR